MAGPDLTGQLLKRVSRSFYLSLAVLPAAVREEAGRGATLEETKARVTARLAPTYEKPFSVYGSYRPWRAGLAANVERTFSMVS